MAVIRHHRSIDEVLELFEKDVVANQMRNLFRLGDIEYLWTADGSLIPSITSPFASAFLYRGQTARYRPCLPSVFRGISVSRCESAGWAGLSLAERVRLIVERVRLDEFVSALFDHPASAYAREIGLKLHPMALAQHYELATDRLDLTQDQMVAAFFATNTRTEEGWVPVDAGTGVMYRLAAGAFRKHMPGKLVCIGKQTLPRPGEQKAHTLTLQLVLDFERLPIEIYTFSQDSSCGQRLNDRFNGGASLFPPDVLAEVAETICSEPSVPEWIVAWLLSNDAACRDIFAGTSEQFGKLLLRYSHIRFSDRDRIGLSASQKVRASQALEMTKQTFLDKVGALAVRNAPVECEGLSSEQVKRPDVKTA
jgi:hypothetical protein